VDGGRLVRCDEGELIEEAQKVAERVWTVAQPLFAKEGMA
jgi:hypothetical protein